MPCIAMEPDTGSSSIAGEGLGQWDGVTYVTSFLVDQDLAQLKTENGLWIGTADRSFGRQSQVSFLVW